MIEQFLGKPFWITFGGLAAAFIVGFFAIHTPASGVITILIALITFALAMKKLEYGLAMTFAEVIATSHGHLFDLTIGSFAISARMAIFAAVMLAWAIQVVLRKRVMPWGDWRLPPFIALVLVAALGFVIGWTHNAHADVINDGDVYIFALYILPVLSIEWNAIRKRLLLQVLAGASSFVAVLTLVILYLFIQSPEPVMRALYTYLRDDRVAELTRISGDIFRIFLPAQFFLCILLLIGISAAFWCWNTRKNQNIIFAGILLPLAGLITSLSRSFWTGLIAGGATIAVAIGITRRPSPKEVAMKAALGLLMVITSVALVWDVLAFPLPHIGNISGFGSLLSARTTDSSDVAISSRWNLMPAMFASIKAAPILGSGFGTIVAFQSDDPRVRAIYPDGKWRTYAFEWGWLDAWLKMGILGPIVLLWLGVAASIGLIRTFKKDSAWLSIALFGGLICLYVTHFFSPYLNHPIGIGYLLFLVPFMEPKTKKAADGAMVSLKEVITERFGRTPVEIPGTTSAVSLQVEPEE